MFLFLDLETTGLDPDTATFVELACMVVHERTLEVNESLNFVRKFTRDEWSACTPFIIAMHRRHGLLEESVVSDVTIEHVEASLLRLIKKYEDDAKAAGKRLYLVLAGSSVHFDRAFLKKHLPLVHEKLFYRQFDVSSLYPIFFNVERFPTHPIIPKDQQPHRAPADIQASLSIARHYKQAVERLVELAETCIDYQLAVEACEGVNDGADVEEAAQLGKELKRLAQAYHEAYPLRTSGLRGHFKRTPA